MVTLGAHGFNMDRLTRRLGRGDDRFGGEVERNTQDIGVLDVEQAFLI